jgi:small subunit ribosomal protein S18
MPIPTILRKPCLFCTEKISFIDYKDTQFLRRFISPHAKILSSPRLAPAANTSAWFPKAQARRHMALLPFVAA